MATTFHIPRQTDLALVLALTRICSAASWKPGLKVFAHIDHQGWVQLPDDNPEDSEAVKFAVELNSNVFVHFSIKDPSRNALTVDRDLTKIYDAATVHDDWLHSIPDAPSRARRYAQMVAFARAELKAHDLDASLKGLGDDAWNRYRDAQTTVINSLQQATETLLLKASERNAELDRNREERFAKLDEKLQNELAEQKTALEKQIADQRANLGQREKALTDREAAFETKESRYVSRQKQGEQIKQIQDWLKDWHLTEGTRKKRTPIFWAYITALVLTGALTAFSISHSYDLLKSADDLAKLQWWHWLALTLKTLLPLAAFTTFMVYFIRWTGDWAHQHAKEEFRNRTLLIDIGRSSWLLEAVRDAHERNKEIPVDLLKELSRNLFANTAGADLDVHPQAAADVLLQGLSSLRVKSPGGAEVEAKREK
jgi:hypothetical protein